MIDWLFCYRRSNIGRKNCKEPQDKRWLLRAPSASYWSACPNEWRGNASMSPFVPAPANAWTGEQSAFFVNSMIRTNVHTTAFPLWFLVLSNDVAGESLSNVNSSARIGHQCLRHPVMKWSLYLLCLPVRCVSTRSLSDSSADLR